MAKFTRNIGEVVTRDHESFWIFPSEYMKNQEYFICSPWFTCMGEKWRLIKEPYTEITVNEGTIFCYRSSDLIFRLWKKIRSSNSSEYRYTIELCLVTTDGDQFLSCIGKVDPDYGCQLRFPDSMNKLFSQNGLVKLFFSIQKEENINAGIVMKDEEISADDEESEKEDENSEDEVNNEDEANNKDVENLTQNPNQVTLNDQMIDTVLRVENCIFKVHKAILIAHSSVFASMYQYHPPLEGKKLYEFTIHKCTAESFEVFRDYLYTGRADTMSTSNVCNLYNIADRYQVRDLKEKCVKFMQNNLTVETICDFIASSTCDESSKLQKAAIIFFCKNIKKVIKTAQWLKYMTENPNQANELLIKALKA